MPSTPAVRPPQFDIRRPCAACPFAPHGLKGLPRAFLREVLDGDAPFGCHKTTTEQGRALNHPKARYCAGHLRFTLQEGRPGTHVRLARTLKLWDPERDLDPDAEIYPDRAALFDAHGE